MADTLGSLIIDLEGIELKREEKELLTHPLVGGIVLFARNYESPLQLQRLCRAVRAARTTPLLIMVDQEGGRVQRFLNEFTRLPYLSLFGKMYLKNPELALQMAKESAWLMATELLSVGVDLSLAPVLDLNKNISSVIGERAFHASPTIVSQLAKAYMQGMREAGMAATGKHFPGHGSIVLDSHIAIPVDERDLDTILKEDMQPFIELINAGIPSVMAAHIIFPAVDNLPVGYSARWLKEILRTKLGFAGIIQSDDLSMEGANISSNYADRVLAAREAGCDLTLLCNNRKGVIQAIDSLDYQAHLINKEKWGVLAGDFSRVPVQLKDSKRWQAAREFLQGDTQKFIHSKLIIDDGN
jgi:beta-N-acetylhexosaminidase